MSRPRRIHKLLENTVISFGGNSEIKVLKTTPCIHSHKTNRLSNCHPFARPGKAIYLQILSFWMWSTEGWSSITAFIYGVTTPSIGCSLDSKINLLDTVFCFVFFLWVWTWFWKRMPHRLQRGLCHLKGSTLKAARAEVNHGPTHSFRMTTTHTHTHTYI